MPTQRRTEPQEPVVETPEAPKTTGGELVPSGQQGMTMGVALPDYIPMSNAGMEGMTREDIKMPRLAIAQSLSPQMIESKPEFLPDLKLGQMFNTVTGEIYGKGPLELAVVRIERPKWMQFDENRKMVDPDVPVHDPRTLWRVDPVSKKRLPPIATQFYDFIVTLLDSGETLALSCAKTNIDSAKTLNALLRGRIPPVPTYARRISVSTAVNTNDKGTWYTFVFKNVGSKLTNSDLVSREQFGILKGISESLAEVIHFDRGVEDTATDADTFDVQAMEAQGRPGGM